MSDDAAPATGALSMDDAISLITNAPAAEPRREDEQPAAEELPATPEAEDEATPPEEAASGEEDAEQPEPEAEELPAIEAPHSWDAEAKAKFAALPRDVQEYLTARESERDKAVSTAQREAAEARTKAEAELSGVQTLAEQLNEFLPQAVQTFQSRWGARPDWTAVAEQYGAEEAFKLKTQYEAEQAQLGELARKSAEASDIAHRTFVSTEMKKLETISPTMAGEQGAKLRSEVAAYAVEKGWATPQDLRGVSAAQLEMARKAMLYDRAQQLKTQAPKPAPAPQVRPSGAQPTSSQSRTVDTLSRRLSQTGRIDDAVELLMARKRG